MATRNCANASYAEVNNAVNGVAGGNGTWTGSPAADGDIVNVPAGTATWTAPLVWTSNIQLIGAGADYTNFTTFGTGGPTYGLNAGNATIITSSFSNVFFKPTYHLSDHLCRISGFVLDATQPLSGAMMQISGKNYMHNVGGVVKGGVRIDNIRYRAPNDTPTSLNLSNTLNKIVWGGVSTTDFLTGSFDHNFFDFLPQSHSTGLCDFNCPGAPDTGAPDNTPNIKGQWSWCTPYIHGGGVDKNPKNGPIWIEDNIFHKSGLVVDASLQGGGHFVVRHNTSYGLIAGHGNESGNNMGPASFEYYNNNFIGNVATSTPEFSAITFRGGTRVLANNRFTGYVVGSVPPYVVSLFRGAPGGSSGTWGPGDGTNFFELNERGPITKNGQSFTPVATQNNDLNFGAPGTPVDTRLGSVYVQSGVSAANGGTFNTTVASFDVTITVGNPGVFTTRSAHGFSNGDVVYFVTSGTLPGGLIANKGYYVMAATSTTFQIGYSSNVVASVITTASPVQSGIHVVHQIINPYSIALKNSEGVPIGGKFTLIGLDGTAAVDKFRGFCLRTLPFAMPEADGGQRAGPSAVSWAYAAMISGSTQTNPTTVTIFGPLNQSGFTGGTYWMSPIEQWEMRRVKTFMGTPGSGTISPKLNGGNNSTSPPSPMIAYVSGSPLQRWSTANKAFGIWQKDNLQRHLITDAWITSPDTDTPNNASEFIPGGCHDGVLPSDAGDGLPYPLQDSTTPVSNAAARNNLRIGADWEAPGTLAPNWTSERILWNDPSAAATQAVGSAYPNPLVSGAGITTTKVVSLTGTGLAFGDVAVGTSATGNLNIANVGNTILTLNASPGVTYPTAFTGANENSVTIAAGASVNVTVTFTPVSAIGYSGNITVNSDATSGTNTIAVSGNGTIPGTRSISLSGSLTFGNVEFHKSSSLGIIIQNTGNQDVHVSGISDGVVDGVFTYDYTSGTIATGSLQVVNVTFTPPDASSSFSRTITISFSDTSPTVSGTNTILATGQDIKRKIRFLLH